MEVLRALLPMDGLHRRVRAGLRNETMSDDGSEGGSLYILGRHLLATSNGLERRRVITTTTIQEAVGYISGLAAPDIFKTFIEKLQNMLQSYYYRAALHNPSFCCFSAMVLLIYV